MHAAASSPLAQRGIVVTRPVEQADAFARRLREMGAHAIVFPTIAIRPPLDSGPLRRALTHLDTYDYAVFVSANAVEQSLRNGPHWPSTLRAVAPGPGTAAALAQRGVREVIVPQQSYDSEGLLALPELGEVTGKRFLIFRGDGGRELLGDTLRARGARVDYVTAYRRAKPEGDAQVLLDAWCERRIDALTVTSSEGLDNLWALLGDSGQERLRGTPTFAPHARIGTRAQSLGLREIIVTAAGDTGLLAGLTDYFRQRTPLSPTI